LANVDIHYCTYLDVLSGKIPASTILFIDEIDSFFFADEPKIIEGKFISAILLLNKHKVIGMTATFRGDQGQAKLSAFLRDSIVFTTGAVISERVLALDVHGNLEESAIMPTIVEVAKTKQIDHPVIVILPSIAECEQLKPQF